MNPEWVGMLAAVLTTVAYIPQALKVAQTRQTKAISLGMFSMITCGIGFWFIYGIMIESPSIIIANGLTFLMAGYILAMKIKYK